MSESDDGEIPFPPQEQKPQPVSEQAAEEQALGQLQQMFGGGGPPSRTTTQKVTISLPNSEGSGPGPRIVSTTRASESREGADVDVDIEVEWNDELSHEEYYALCEIIAALAG